MGIVKKDALRTTVISYFGLLLGYLNKAVLFILLLSTVQIGIVNLLITSGLFFAQLSNLGTIYVTWRFFPFFRNADKKHYGFLLLNFLLVLFGVALFTALFFLFQKPINAYFVQKSPMFVDYAWWVVPVGIGHVFFLLFENYMRGLYKNVLPVFLQDIGLRILTTLILALYGFNLISFNLFVAILTLSNLLPALVLMLYLLRVKELTFTLKTISVSRRFRRILLKFSLFSYVNTLASIVVVTMDAVMIGGMIGLSAVGIYTTMVQITSAVLVPFRSMTRVSSPVVAKYWKEKDLKGLQDIYQKSSGVGLFIGLSSFLAIFLPVNELFSLIRTEFQQGIPVLFFLLLGRLVDMYCGLNGIIFATSKKYQYDLVFTLMLCFGIFGLNYVLISAGYGIAGVGFATGLMYFIYNAARSFYIYKAYGLNPFRLSHVKLFALAWGLVTLIAFLQWLFPFEPRTTFLTLLRIASVEILILLTFVLPVIYFNLEPEVSGFIRRISADWKKKYFKL
jgi:O-antigen/teichoic acid export membrane protein